MANTIKTLDDVINYKSRYDLNKVLFFTQTDDETLIIPDTNLFTIYRRYINPYIGTYRVNNAQREYYRRKPYLLSADTYGTPELGWLILMLNDQECASKFYLKTTVKLIPGTYLEELYDTIVTKSNERLENNWNKYLTKL